MSKYINKQDNVNYSFRKPRNQYSPPETDEFIYNWLMDNCEDHWDKTGTFCCWIPPIGTRGLDFYTTPAGQPGHIRFSRRRKKVLAHVFVKSMHMDQPYGKVGSHLCHNGFCLRHDHIVWEEQSRAGVRDNNIGRIGCPGYIVFKVGKVDKWIRACGHTIPCKKVTRKIVAFNCEIHKIKDQF